MLHRLLPEVQRALLDNAEKLDVAAAMLGLQVSCSCSGGGGGGYEGRGGVQLGLHARWGIGLRVQWGLSPFVAIRE